MELFIFYIILCLLLGKMGSERTIGFWLAFLSSFFLTPLLGLVLILLSREVHLTQSYGQQHPQPFIVHQTVSEPKKQDTDTGLDALKKEKLSKILDDWENGVITEEQYKIKKEKIMLL